MTKVLVCGGRDFFEREFVFRQLDKYHAQYKFTQVIHGAAPGVDSLVHEWAALRGVERRPFPAQWKTFKNAAGHIRNEQMLVEGQPDMVVAFPGGAGTSNMIKQTLNAGLPLITVSFFPDKE